MWSDEEAVTHCPDCDVDLVPLHALPPSAETVLEREAELEQVPEEFRRRGLFDLGRGRGLLILLALLGLFGFFQPWFVLRKPDEVVLNGFRIARHFAGWVWGGAIGWFILIPLVFTRRTIAGMRGVRGVCVFFTSLSLAEILVLANVSPTSKVHVPIEFGWCWGLFFSAVVSVLGAIVSFNFGGPLPRRKGQQEHRNESVASTAGQSADQPTRYETLH
jgi:hypothetical protein